MDYETGVFVYKWLCGLVLDARFQVLFGFGLLAQWAWRLPRPRKGAGNRAVFITGCDIGPSHRIARRFDKMGLHVFAGCLHPDEGGARVLKENCSINLHIVPIDISKDDSVKEAVAYVKGNLPVGEKGLYGLINSAGISAHTALDLMTTEMCEEVIDKNLMGAIRVTKQFLPLITQAQGRIVTITSSLTFPFAAVYSATKQALNGFFSSLRYELLNTGVKVSLVEPENFPHTSDIMKWTQKNLNGFLSNSTSTEEKEKLYSKSKRIQTAKGSPTSREINYKYLLDDVEDAMLAEEPYFRYISAPFVTRMKLWIARNLSEELYFKMVAVNLSEGM